MSAVNCRDRGGAKFKCLSSKVKVVDMKPYLSYGAFSDERLTLETTAPNRMPHMKSIALRSIILEIFA